MELPSCLVVNENQSPYSRIPEQGNKFIRLKKVLYKPGYYRMERVMGYDLFRLSHAMSVTNLQVRDKKWHTLMVDDPLHWLGMGELARQSKPPRVLVAGLGMGLILHHLVNRPDVTEITVVEIDPELIAFIRHFLPVDSRIKIVQADFFAYLLASPPPFDTAILDLWVIRADSPQEHRRHVAETMGIAKALCLMRCPEAMVLTWGIREQGAERRK